MAVLFVSHSSEDDAAASALEAWLSANGFSDIFVDHHAILGGEKWRDALRASAGACRVVVCLVSAHWLASHECFNEFRAAWYMGKRIIPLFLLPPAAANLDPEAKQRLAEVCAEDQGIDLLSCLDAAGALRLDGNHEIAERLRVALRAAGALSRIGLDPQAFAIDAKLRPTPFPGLASFGDEDADAALLYGRSREVAHTLEELRKMRAERDVRPLIILGASGAGKSSLLKAGIIPRLRREAQTWLPLRAFRAGADPLLNFAEALARTLADFGKAEAHGVIRDRLRAAWLAAEREGNALSPAGRARIEAAIEAEGARLREAAGRPVATILVSVDQAEEMARADGESGEALADYLRAAAAVPEGRWQLAFTIRTDSFPELQSHRRFQDLEARGYDLRAIPVFRFDSVVEEPAKRYGVEVDPILVDALMEDAPKEDALPLLAFALQRLWRQYAASGALTKDQYDKVGGLTGLIEDAAERALRGIEPEQDVALPSGPLPKRLDDLGVATFVPALAQVNEQGATIRRVADWGSFEEAQQDLLRRFDRWRLVVRKGEADGGTVEVAHEALFRKWTRLASWLEPERARLDALRALQIDAAAWDRNGRDAAFLNHRDKRLAEACALAATDGYRQRMHALELDYLAACSAAGRAARGRARRVRAALAVLGFLISAGLIGWWNEVPLRRTWYWFSAVRPYVLTGDAERALKPLESFRECAPDCPEMVVIPAGRFVMGSPKTEHGRSEYEGPQHEVVFAKPFAIGRFDVTFDEWDACVAYGECVPLSDSGWGDGPQPVINVSWDDARHYVAWLSKITGKTYRLLSEAEWEYAARGKTQTAYFFGDDPALLGDYAWYSENSRGRTHSIDERKKPNPFGLYDMHGNVWQWVEDCYHHSYEEAPTDGSAWEIGEHLFAVTGQGPVVEGVGDCSPRVLRGGSWSSLPQNLRSAGRSENSPVNKNLIIGFRVGRTLTP